jgi:hypothetical protein
VLDIFQHRTPNISVTPQLASFSAYFTKYNADVAAHSTADVQFLTLVPGYAQKGALYELRGLLKKHKSRCQGLHAGRAGAL